MKTKFTDYFPMQVTQSSSIYSYRFGIKLTLRILRGRGNTEYS